MENLRIAVIGVGNMGSAIVRGIAGKFEVTVANRSRGRLERLGHECPQIECAASNTEAVRGAAMAILAVEPDALPGVVAEIGPSLAASTTLVSLSAAFTLDDLAAMLPDGASRGLVKAIPNTAVAVGSGMTFLSARNVTAERLGEVETVFGTLGGVDVIAEAKMRAATALASCGLAFAMRYIRAAVQGAVELGLPPEDALRYEIATLRGACHLLERRGRHPEAEIDGVTTPGGITIRGLNAMEDAGFSAAVIRGLKASGV